MKCVQRFWLFLSKVFLYKQTPTQAYSVWRLSGWERESVYGQIYAASFYNKYGDTRLPAL